MKFTTAAIAAASAAVVAATPAGVANAAPLKAGEVFQIMSLRSATPVHFGKMTASNNGFQINNPHQDASCGPEPTDYAQFVVTEDSELYLYTANPPQQAFIDRSGMGQGIFQYTTGVQGAPRNGERKGFAFDENNYLTFDGKGFQACPNGDAGYTVLLSGVENPAGYKNCTPFSAQALKVEKPVKCSYKVYSA
jgi:hypothetical protein